MTPSETSSKQVHVWRQVVGWALVLIATAFLFAIVGTPGGDSVVFNLTWHSEVRDLLANGSFPPRHLPGGFGGLGILDFFFYGPLPYIFTAGADILLCRGCSAGTAFAFGSGLGLGLSALSFTYFARRFVPVHAALIAAAAYAIMPYHLAVDWVVRQAGGEFFAYVLIPLVAAGFDVALRERRLAPSFILGFAALCMTHLPTAMLAGHVFAIVFVVWALALRPGLHAVGAAFLRLGAMTLAGALLSAAVWLPAIATLSDVSAQVLREVHITPIPYLLGPGMSPPNPIIVIQIAICIGSVLVMYAMCLRADNDRYTKLLFLQTPIFACLILMSQLSLPIWEYWIIKSVQFPWRLMVFCDLAGAMAIALFAASVPSIKDRRLAFSGIAGVLVAANVICLALFKDAHETIEDLDYQIGIRAGATEYLPPAALSNLQRLEVAHVQKSDLYRDILKRASESGRGYASFTLNARQALASPAEGSTEMILPFFHWKHWTGVDADGTKLVLEAEPELGLTQVRREDGDAFAGETIITLPWLWSEKAGALLSLLGLIGLAIILSWRRPARRLPEAAS